MYQVLSDIKLLDRFDLVSEDVIVSGFQGSWVNRNSDNKAVLIADAGWSSALGVAYPVWTEENRDGTQGFTPDTAQTTKVTVLSGPHRALTDRYAHESGELPTLGCYLIPGAGEAAASIGSASASGTPLNGMLRETAVIGDSNIRAVAVCTRAPFLYTPVHGGTARYVIEIQVL
jgi:hypothetical protein